MTAEQPHLFKPQDFNQEEAEGRSSASTQPSLFDGSAVRPLIEAEVRPPHHPSDPHLAIQQLRSSAPAPETMNKEENQEIQQLKATLGTMFSRLTKQKGWLGNRDDYIESQTVSFLITKEEEILYTLKVQMTIIPYSQEIYTTPKEQEMKRESKALTVQSSTTQSKHPSSPYFNQCAQEFFYQLLDNNSRESQYTYSIKIPSDYYHFIKPLSGLDHTIIVQIRLESTQTKHQKDTSQPDKSNNSNSQEFWWQNM